MVQTTSLRPRHQESSRRFSPAAVCTARQMAHGGKADGGVRGRVRDGRQFVAEQLRLHERAGQTHVLQRRQRRPHGQDRFYHLSRW